MSLVDKAFLQWERINQPRRARARLFATLEPAMCVLAKTDLTKTQSASGRTVNKNCKEND